MSRRAAGLVLLLLTGCDGGDADSAPDESVYSPPPTSPSMQMTAMAGFCDSGFGLSPGTLHVRSWGDDFTADGTGTHPFQTIEAALAFHAFRSSPASSCHTLDFETDAAGNPLVAGQRVEQAYAAWGVTIEAHHKNFNKVAEAIVFDSSAPTGNDDDLGTPSAQHGGPGQGAGGGSNTEALGNVLIRPQHTKDQNNDGLIDEPNDHSAGAGFVFKFASDVCIKGITFLDLDDSDSSVSFAAADGTVLSSLVPENTGDNGVNRLTTNTCGVRSLTVVLNGSGALDNIEFCDETPPPTDPQKAHITLGRGDYEANITVPADFDLTVEGCTASTTHIAARNAAAPVFLTEGGTLSLTHLDVTGGTPTLWARSGATLTLDHVRVTDSNVMGVAVTEGSTLYATNVSVLRTSQSTFGDMGWGIGVQDSEMVLTDVVVQGAYEIGIFGDNSLMTMRSVEVIGTQSGLSITNSRAVQLQNGTDAVIYDTRLSQNGTGLLGLDMSFLQADSILIDITGQGIIHDPSTGILIDITGQGLQSWTTGDGIVLVGQDTEPFPAWLSNNTILESSRAAVVLEDVNATLNANVTAANSLTVNGKQMFKQGTVKVKGTDATLVQQLEIYQELALDRTPSIMIVED